MLVHEYLHKHSNSWVLCEYWVRTQSTCCSTCTNTVTGWVLCEYSVRTQSTCCSTYTNTVTGWVLGEYWVRTQSTCSSTAPLFLCSLVKTSSGNSWMAVGTRRSIVIRITTLFTYNILIVTFDIDPFSAKWLCYNHNLIDTHLKDTFFSTLF